VKRRNPAAVVGQLMLDALAGKLGVPMMVVGYVTFAVLLLAYVSLQVYTNSLMEGVSARKREELALQEQIGVLTAQYATMTSKSRISQYCEEDLGLVTATMNEVVRVAIDSRAIDEMAPRPVERVGETLTEDIHDLTQVMGK
jgi:hypothetical protein